MKCVRTYLMHILGDIMSLTLNELDILRFKLSKLLKCKEKRIIEISTVNPRISSKENVLFGGSLTNVFISCTITHSIFNNFIFSYSKILFFWDINTI